MTDKQEHVLVMVFLGTILASIWVTIIVLTVSWFRDFLSLACRAI